MNVAALSVAGREALMANKDKGRKSTKKAATKDLKQKRREKKAKRDEFGGRQSNVQ
jgi:hypothetical protein